MVEILLYDPFYSYSAKQLITDLETNKESDIVIRMNTPGGEVYQVYGSIAKFVEHPQNKKIKVDGIAASGGAFMCCVADDVECLDVSSFMFHRASIGQWMESIPEYFTDDVKADLAKTNKQLRALMEGKFTAQKWKEVTGTTLNDLFSLDQRIDVRLDAKQAKALGLVSKINPITPQKKAEMIAYAKGEFSPEPAAPSPIVAKSDPVTAITEIKTQNKMNLEQFKAQHPEAYADAVKIGVSQERDRVGAFLVYIDADTAAVKKGIEEGNPISQTAMAELSLKVFSKNALKTMEGENAATVQTEEKPVGTPAEVKTTAQMEAFNKDLRAELGLK